MNKLKVILPLVNLTTLSCLSVSLTSCGATEAPLCFKDIAGDGKQAIVGYTISGGKLDLDIECKLDDSDWKDWDGSKITLEDGQRLYVRNRIDTLSSPNKYLQFNTSGGFVRAYGNVNSLINYKQLSPYCFNSLFADCKTLKKGPDLPATTLVKGCYQNMFVRSGLTVAPSLPAKEMAENCYFSMFGNCTYLETPPKLESTTLAPHCYEQMFDCAGLTTAPQLPAENLADNCYAYMFRETLITQMPELPSTHLADYCYYFMFANCNQLEHTIKQLPATQLKQSCYDHMFAYCSNLITAPELKGQEYDYKCYEKMFKDCPSLNVQQDLSQYHFICSFIPTIQISGIASEMFGIEHGTRPWQDNGTPIAGHSYYYY